MRPIDADYAGHRTHTSARQDGLESGAVLSIGSCRVVSGGGENQDLGQLANRQAESFVTVLGVVSVAQPIQSGR